MSGGALYGNAFAPFPSIATSLVLVSQRSVAYRLPRWQCPQIFRYPSLLRFLPGHPFRFLQ
jgi:hypothetical protein